MQDRSRFDSQEGCVLMARLCHGDQRLPSFPHIADRGLESEPKFLASLEQINTVSIDTDHLRRVTLTVVPQRIAMVIVHVLNDLQFLRRRIWIFCHKLVSFYPVDLAKSGNESNPHEFQPEKREIMSLVILSRGWKVSEISI